jgi:hypothetical protein
MLNFWTGRNFRYFSLLTSCVQPASAFLDAGVVTIDISGSGNYALMISMSFIFFCLSATNLFLRCVHCRPVFLLYVPLFLLVLDCP